LAPLDEGTILTSLKKTDKIVIVKEAVKRGSYSAEISAIIAEKGFDYLKAPIIRVVSENMLVLFSPGLKDFVLPNQKKIIDAVKNVK